MDRLSQTIDPSDGRYADVLFNAATFYRQASDITKAVDFYTRTVDEGNGILRDRAQVWVTILE